MGYSGKVKRTVAALRGKHHSPAGKKYLKSKEAKLIVKPTYVEWRKIHGHAATAEMMKIYREVIKRWPYGPK